MNIFDYESMYNSTDNKKEHLDYFMKPKMFDRETYYKKIINWYMAEIEKEKDINLVYHLAETNFSNDEVLIKEYKELFEE